MLHFAVKNPYQLSSRDNLCFYAPNRQKKDNMYFAPLPNNIKECFSPILLGLRCVEQELANLLSMHINSSIFYVIKKLCRNKKIDFCSSNCIEKQKRTTDMIDKRFACFLDGEHQRHHIGTCSAGIPYPSV